MKRMRRTPFGFVRFVNWGFEVTLAMQIGRVYFQTTIHPTPTKCNLFDLGARLHSIRVRQGLIFENELQLVLLSAQSRVQLDKVLVNGEFRWRKGR